MLNLLVFQENLLSFYEPDQMQLQECKESDVTTLNNVGAFNKDKHRTDLATPK